MRTVGREDKFLMVGHGTSDRAGSEESEERGKGKGLMGVIRAW